MGAKHEDTNIQCPYCCNHTQKREGFSRIQNLMGSEWVIYRPNDHTENDAPAGQAGRSKNTLGNVFVLYNRKNKQMVTADLFFQLNKQTIPCQRCRIKNEHAHTLILCDHCLLKTEIENPCHKCENIINNFLSTRGEATSPINKYFKLWLTKMEHKLNKSICEIKPQKILQRSYSDINNYVPKQEKFKTVKCRIKQMFHSEVNLTATSRKKEGIEKSVHFTGYVDFFQSSESYIDDADKLAFKHSQSSEEAKSSKSIIAKSLMNHLGRENFMEKQQNLIGSALEKDSSFIFPQDTLKSDIILSRYVSSSELIKDIQEKIQFKVAEEENKIRESHRREIEAENTKGLTDDDNKMLINIEEHKQEIPAKLKPRDLSPKAEKSKYFEQQIQESEKHSGLSEEKTSEKSRPILAEANKSTKGSTKQLESEDVSEKVIKDKNKSVNERNQEEHFKDKMIERDKENLGKINKTLKSRKTFEGKIFPHLKDIHKLRKPKNSEDQNEKEMPTSDTRKSGKIKNIESEKSQDVKHRKPDAIDVMSDLTRKKGLSKLSATHDNLEKQKLSKTKKVQDLNEKEMPISDARQLDKTKNMLSEKMQDIKKVTKPDAMDIISQLTRKKGPPNLSSSDDNLEKQKLSKTKKVEDLNEKDTKQLDKINNIEFEKTQDIKKVRKPDTMDIISELTRKKEGKIKFTSNDDNLDNKRETALQSVDKNNSKKANNVKESKENEKKLNQIKIQKIDDDDVISKLIKSNASDVGKKKEQLTVTGKSEMVDVLEGLNIKLLEVSKLQLEATKVKEKLAEKLNSVPETKKKEDKSVLPSKEKQEKELKFNEVKLVDNNFDNLILRLINIRATEKTGHVPKVESFQIKTKYRQHMDKQNLELEDKPISESDILECSANEQPIQKAIDYGLGPLPAKFTHPQRKGQDIKPLYRQLEFSTLASITGDQKKEELADEDRKEVDPDEGKGVIRYALSDRTFIEKGWTMLPVEKVVRKMNIYRMRPAHPEFDWFEHNKNKCLMLYDTGAKLAEFDDNGRGRWYYKNGRLALDYYEAEETNTQQRFVVYSNGELDERGRSRPITILATFDHLGNGVVFDHAGKIRLKYNQTEGVLLDRSVGPVTNWKWHSLNDPPVLQQVMIDTQLPLKDPQILKMGGPADNRTRPDNEEMLAIEFENFIKEKSKKLTQKFKPFQIKMKALKINEHFSLKVLDQATIYLIFRDGSANLKLNIGMVLDHKEIVDTDIAELGEVLNSMERFPARTDSLAVLQSSVAYAQRYERMRTERERRVRRPEPCLSADNLGKAASRPLRTPLRILPSFQTGITSLSETSTGYCKCTRKPSSSLYYSTQIL